MGLRDKLLTACKRAFVALIVAVPGLPGTLESVGVEDLGTWPDWVRVAWGFLASIPPPWPGIFIGLGLAFLLYAIAPKFWRLLQSAWRNVQSIWRRLVRWTRRRLGTWTLLFEHTDIQWPGYIWFLDELDLESFREFRAVFTRYKNTSEGREVDSVSEARFDGLDLLRPVTRTINLDKMDAEVDNDQALVLRMTTTGSSSATIGSVDLQREARWDQDIFLVSFAQWPSEPPGMPLPAVLAKGKTMTQVGKLSVYVR